MLGEIQAKNITFDTTICLHTLYSYIDKGVFLHLTNKDLPQRGKRKNPHSYKRVRAARAPKGESIENRPKEVNERYVFGHWEGDTVYGKKRSRRTLLVFTERLTRNEVIMRIKDRTATSVVKAMDTLERRYGKRFKDIFKSITFDNGSEFSDCDGMERSIYGGKRTKAYYCHPYSSWERGSNENQNGLIRRHYPKGFDFTRTTNAKVKLVEEWVNNYPRQMFGWKSAADIFREHLAAAQLN